MKTSTSPPARPKFDIQPYWTFKFLPTGFLDEIQALMALVAPADQQEAPFTDLFPRWKQAQTRIATGLIAGQSELAAAKVAEKAAHRSKSADNKRDAKQQRISAECRITVLRKTLDAILWQIFDGDQSALRRLYVKDGHHSFNIKNIGVAMAAADVLNADSTKFALCTDMLSLVHLGDLLVVDGSHRKQFIELKSGTKNLELSTAAAFVVESGCEFYEGVLKSGLNPTDSAHYERAKRQITRAKQITETIFNEGGIDHNTGASVNIVPVKESVNSWAPRLVTCYEQLGPSRHWAIADIDGCLFLGVYNLLAMAGMFSYWMQHDLACRSPITNLNESFRIPSARPLGAMGLPEELRDKIFRGEVWVMLCLDLARMIEAADAIVPKRMVLATARETAEARKSRYSFLEHEGRGIKIDSDEGAVMLGSGMRERILYDFQRPSQLINEQMRRFASQPSETAKPQ